MQAPLFFNVNVMVKYPLGGTGLLFFKSTKSYETSSRRHSTLSAESAQTVGVSKVGVDCATEIPSVAAGLAVDVTARAVGNVAIAGTGDGVGCDLHAEKINRINPTNLIFFICIFLCGIVSGLYPCGKIHPATPGTLLNKHGGSRASHKGIVEFDTQ